MSVLIKYKLLSLLESTGDMALKRRAKNIIEGLDLKEGDRVLDVGCGDGYYLHLLSNLGLKLRLDGVDFDESGLNRARKNLGSKIPLKTGDLMKKLPYESGIFDKVIMSEVCEHLPDDVKGLREVRRVMKNGAILCLTVPCTDYPFLWDPINWTLEKLFNTHIKSGFFAGIWNQHIRLYKVREIRKVVEKTGFQVEAAKALTWWCLPFNHYIVNLTARIIAHLNLSSGLKSSLSKYSKKPQRGIFLDLAFSLANFIDGLNDIWSFSGKGVSVFIKAKKT